MIEFKMDRFIKLIELKGKQTYEDVNILGGTTFEEVTI